MFHRLTCLAMVLTVVAIREVRGQQNDDPEPGTGEDLFMGSGPYQYYNPGGYPAPAPGQGGYNAGGFGSVGGSVSGSMNLNTGANSNTMMNIQNSQMHASGSTYTNTGINTGSGEGKSCVNC